MLASKGEHIVGSLHRYVFDGKPPDMKSGELVKRAEKRAEAEKELAQAQEQGMYIHIVHPCNKLII